MNRNLSFITLHTSLALARATERSPYAQILYRGQIQLKPLDPKPYRQITNQNGNIIIGTGVQVDVVTCRGVVLENVDSNVQVNQLTDSKGYKQAAIGIFYMPSDYGSEPVHLKIQSTFNEVVYTYYSNPILITDNGIEYTTRIDYFNNREYTNPDIEIVQGVYESTRLSLYYQHYVTATERTEYYQITTQQDVITRANPRRHGLWIGEFDEYTLKRFENAIDMHRCYLDFQRSYLLTPEYDGREASSNINEAMLTISQDDFEFITVPDVIPGEDTVPFLASSGSFASSGYLVSQPEIPAP